MPAALWGGLIFFLSSQSAPPQPEPIAALPLIDKLEHFIEYALLALLVLFGLRRGPRLPRPLSPDFHAHLAFAAAALYAWTDEVHQAFVPLRRADAADFFFDALGAFVAAFAFSALVAPAPSPLQPPDRELKFREGRVRYLLRGDGPPILYLHGWHGSKRYFVHAAARLPAFKHLAPDLLGFGASEAPARFSYSPRAEALIARALARSLGIKSAVVVGHCMGGAVAVELALADPSFVRALVLVEPALRLPVPYPFFFTKEESGAIGLGVARHFLGLRTGPLVHLLVEDPRSFPRPLIEDALSVPLHASVRSLSGLVRANLVKRLGEVGCPTLLVFGDAKHAVRAKYARILADALPSAALVHIPNTSHSPMIEASDEFYKCVGAFLDRVGAAGGSPGGGDA